MQPNSSASSALLPGQPHIAYKNGDLYVENQRVADLAVQHGTPLFVYSKASMLDALAAYQRGFEGRNARVHYAMKANSSLGVLQVFVQAGCGFDIVSGGELDRVIAAGGDPAWVELEVLSEVAVSTGKTANVSLRVNPNVDPQTHPYISTGLKGSKFGVAHDRTVTTYQRAAALPGLKVVGIDCHIGSQIVLESPYLDAVDRMLDLVESIEAAGIPIHHLDFGGGLGINYNGETPPAADDLWHKLLAKLDTRGFGQRQLMIEPGRSLVGNAGICITEVLYLKPGEQKNFCIIDAAMNDLPRPAMYQAYHAIINIATQAINTPVIVENGIENEIITETIYDVVGPVCESGDWIGRDRALSVKQGDLLAVLSAGAYCMSMASNYNTRGRATEVLVDGDKAHVIRQRENSTDQMRHERLIT
jgi:diaminopimelate decarboxylase